MRRGQENIVISLRVPRALADAYRRKAGGDGTAAALMRTALEEAMLTKEERNPLWVSPDVWSQVIQEFGEDYTDRLDKLLRFYFADVMS